MKKILLFSRDPGGANTIIPLFKQFDRALYEVDLFGKDYALDRYTKFGLSGENIVVQCPQINPENIESFIKKRDPHFIITGTSLDDKTEKYIWMASRRLSIPSFAIFDQWMNYRLKFSKYSGTESVEFNNDNNLRMLYPYKIVVMDEYAKNQAIEEGIDERLLFVGGQPYFEMVKAYKKDACPERAAKMKRSMKIREDEYVITFASEPLSKIFGSHALPPFYWGYSEKTTFDELIRAVEAVIEKANIRVALIIRLHPKEDADAYDEIVKKISDPRIRIIIDRMADQWDLILMSDLIAGMYSMFLLEAVLLEKPMISIQIGLKQKDPFILSRMGIAPSVTDSGKLTNELKRIILDKDKSCIKFDLVENPTSRIIGHMEEILCRN